MKEQFFSTLSKPFPFRQNEFGLVVDIADEQLCELANLPEPRLHRSMSRSAILLSTLFHDLNEALNRLSIDRKRIGVYASLAKGAPMLHLAEEALKLTKRERTDFLLAKMPPKQAFREGINFPAAQLSVLLGLRGPLNTFPHWQYGVRHAIEAAEIDFHNEVIDAALVFGAFSLENPFTARALRSKLKPPGLMQEAAAAMLVMSSKHIPVILEDLSKIEIGEARKKFFGYADPLIQLQQNANHS